MGMGAIPTQFPTGYNIGLLICICTNKKLVPPELVLALAAQVFPTHLSVGYMIVKDKPIEEAREIAAAKAIEISAKYLWFIDDDTIMPPNTIKRLEWVLANWPDDVMVCGGVYMTRSDPPSPVIFRGIGLGSFWHWKEGEVFEVTGMGAGCMLINCEVFKKLTPPYFPWTRIDSNIDGQPSVNVSEDINFCEKVRAAGYKVFAHGGVLCDHYDIATGEIYRLPENSYPLRKEVKISPDGQDELTPQELQALADDGKPKKKKKRKGD